VVATDVRDDVGGAVFDKDVMEREDIDELLDAARAQVGELAAEMRTGAIHPCPATCSWRGGCSYPSICRTEQ
jgi:hypothetical protein